MALARRRAAVLLGVVSILAAACGTSNPSPVPSGSEAPPTGAPTSAPATAEPSATTVARGDVTHWQHQSDARAAIVKGFIDSVQGAETGVETCLRDPSRTATTSRSSVPPSRPTTAPASSSSRPTS